MQRNTKIATAGLTVGLLAGGAIGVVAGLPGLAGASGGSTTIEATDPTDPATSDSTDTTIADAPAGDIDADHSDRLQEVLQPLIDDGTLTQDQADAVIAALEAARPEDGMGRRGHGGPGVGHGLDAVAKALGMTEDELRTELQGGSTIADIATAKGVDVQTVIDAVVADRTADIDQAVTDGELTEEQATEIKADLADRVTAMVNGERPEGGPMGRGPGHHHDGDDAATDDATS